MMTMDIYVHTMVPLHLAWIREGMAKPPIRCSIFFVQEHANSTTIGEPV